MNSTHGFLLDSLKEEPIGETVHFVWYITDIGIAALFKGNEILKIYSVNVEKEAKDISLDISKEEFEFVWGNLYTSYINALSEELTFEIISEKSVKESAYNLEPSY